jgi:hypothetical protein
MAFIAETGVLAAAAVVAPNAAEVGVLSALALLCCLPLGSRSVTRAPVIYVKDIGAFSTYLDWAQRMAVIGVLMMWGGMLFMVCGSLLIYWSRVSALKLAWGTVAFASGSVIFMLVKARRDYRSHGNSPRLRELPGFILEMFVEDVLGERPARRVGLALLAVTLGSLLLWGLYRGFAALSGMGYLGGLVFLSIVFCALVSLVLKLSPAKGLLLFYLYRLLGRRPFSGDADAAEWWDQEDEAELFMRVARAAERPGLSPEDRFRLYRRALGRVRSSIFRRKVYDGMAKAYKEKRQKKREGGE